MATKNSVKKMHYIVYDPYFGCSSFYDDMADAEKEAARRVTSKSSTYEAVIYQPIKRAEPKVPVVDWVEYKE